MKFFWPSFYHNRNVVSVDLGAIKASLLIMGFNSFMTEVPIT